MGCENGVVSFSRCFPHKPIKLPLVLSPGMSLSSPRDVDGRHAQRAQAVHIGGVPAETHGHMALRAQVVDFVRLGFLDDCTRLLCHPSP
jgi:hypothetical protein